LSSSLHFFFIIIIIIIIIIFFFFGEQVWCGRTPGARDGKLARPQRSCRCRRCRR
jgi:hypothetical protein